MWTKSCFFKWIPKYYLRKVDDSGVFDFVYIQVSMNKNETRIRRELRWKLLDWLSLQSPSKELAVVVKLQDLHFILCTNALWLHAYHFFKKRSIQMVFTFCSSILFFCKRIGKLLTQKLSPSARTTSARFRWKKGLKKEIITYWCKTSRCTTVTLIRLNRHMICSGLHSTKGFHGNW